MPDIENRLFAVFTVGNGTSIERSNAIRRASAACNGCSSAAPRLPCAFVLANKEDIYL